MKFEMTFALVGCLVLAACSGTTTLGSGSDRLDSNGDPGGESSGGSVGTAAAPGQGGDTGIAAAPGAGGDPGAAAASGSTPETCGVANLAADWPLVVGCSESPFTENNPLRCPHPGLLNEPSYGPFTGCCPLEAPYSCANGTPFSCFATADEALAACGTSCVVCEAP